MNRLAIEQEKELIQKYLNGQSTLRLMKEYNLTYPQAVLNIVKKYNYETKKSGTPKVVTYNKEKFLNPYYETIYWFGFLLADGCIINNGASWTIQIALQYSDLDILQRFQEYFEIKNTKISTPLRSSKRFADKKYKACKLSFTVDEQIINYLKIFGIVQRKSLINYKPDIGILNNENLIKSFIRGYFDGDGGVCIFQKKNGHGNKRHLAISISWLGTYDFMEWIKTNLFYYLHMEIKAKIICNASIFGFSWGNKEFTKLFYKWLYPPNEFCMMRKKDKIYKYLLEKGCI